MSYIPDQKTIKQLVHQRVERSKYGTIFFISSFPDYDEEYTRQILAELVNKGKLERLANGVFVKVYHTPIGSVYPTTEELVAAIAKRDHAQVLPTGDAALNMLGMSTQVPMKEVYLTSGSSRELNFGGRTIKLMRCTPKNFAIKGDYRKLIVQAMKSIGESEMDDEYMDALYGIIEKHPEIDTLEHDMKLVPVWIKKMILSITNQIRNNHVDNER